MIVLVQLASSFRHRSVLRANKFAPPYKMHIMQLKVYLYLFFATGLTKLLATCINIHCSLLVSILAISITSARVDFDQLAQLIQLKVFSCCMILRLICLKIMQQSPTSSCPVDGEMIALLLAASANIGKGKPTIVLPFSLEEIPSDDPSLQLASRRYVPEGGYD